MLQLLMHEPVPGVGHTCAQVMCEIEERKAFLADMEKAGGLKRETLQQVGPWTSEAACLTSATLCRHLSISPTLPPEVWELLNDRETRTQPGHEVQ
jgi:hypothetical protein